MEPTPLRAAPLRRSLFRTQTVFGGERGPMLMVIVMSALLMLSAMTLFSFVAGTVILLAGVHGLRAAAKLHPQASRVYLQFLKYRRFYPARARHAAPMPHRAVALLGRRPPIPPTTVAAPASGMPSAAGGMRAPGAGGTLPAATGRVTA